MPPPGFNPAQQKLGFKDRLKADFKDNRKSYGDALTQMGLALMSQKSSTMPTSFGQAMGQAATAGFEKFGESVDERRELTQEEEMLERQRLLFEQAQKDRLTQNQYTREDRAREFARQKVADQRAATEFARSGTTYDQNNILFDQGQIDRAEKMRRDNANWERQQEQYKAMTDIDLSGLNPEQQKIFGNILPYMDPNTVGQYFNDIGEEEAAIDMTTTDMKNALFVARAQNPDATEAELSQMAGDIVQQKMIKPQTQVNTMNSPGSKGNQTYSDDLMKKAESSRETLSMLNQFAQVSEGVNTGRLGELIQESASGANQVFRILGMGESWPQERIDKFFETEAGRGSVAQAIGSRLALEMTNQLAGQISEKELAFAINAMPGLMQTPEGNKMIIALLGAKAEQDINRARWVEEQRDPETGALPGRIRAMTMAWDEKNKLKVYDENNNLTDYGMKMREAGLLNPGDDDGWEDD